MLSFVPLSAERQKGKGKCPSKIVVSKTNGEIEASWLVSAA